MLIKFLLTVVVVAWVAALLWLPSLLRDSRRRYLIAAFVAYVTLDAFITLLPMIAPALDLLGGSMNWTGKALAVVLAASTLALMLRRGFTGADLGLQKPDPHSLPKIVLVSFAFLVADFLIMGRDPNVAAASTEYVLYEATMPGLAEELAYRGILLAIANRLWSASARVWGTAISGGALLVAVLFGVVHGIEVTADLGVRVHWLYMIPPAISALLFTWARNASGSLLIPLLVHNAINLAHCIPF